MTRSIDAFAIIFDERNRVLSKRTQIVEKNGAVGHWSCPILQAGC